MATEDEEGEPGCMRHAKLRRGGCQMTAVQPGHITVNKGQVDEKYADEKDCIHVRSD